jgi:hypothetical protein
MSATAALRVIDALVSGFTDATSSLPVDVLVHDGYTISDEGYRYHVNVGVDDPSSDSPAPSVRATQEWAHAAGRKRNEDGEVRSAVTLSTGDNDLSTLRTDAETILAAIKAWVTTNHHLGQPDLFWAAGITEVEVYQQQDDAGAFLYVTFTITYRARLS